LHKIHNFLLNFLPLFLTQKYFYICLIANLL